MAPRSSATESRYSMRDNIQSILAMSPMQEGMLFHTLAASTSGMYVQQLVMRLGGDLDVDLFHKAWARIVERHQALRSAFIWESAERPLQVVFRNVPLACDIGKTGEWNPKTRERNACALSFRRIGRRGLPCVGRRCCGRPWCAWESATTASFSPTITWCWMDGRSPSYSKRCWLCTRACASVAPPNYRSRWDSNATQIGPEPNHSRSRKRSSGRTWRDSVRRRPSIKTCASDPDAHRTRASRCATCGYPRR